MSMFNVHMVQVKASDIEALDKKIAQLETECAVLRRELIANHIAVVAMFAVAIGWAVAR